MADYENAEPSFWDGSFGDIVWGIAKWVGIALAVVVTGGLICHFSPTAHKWLDDNFNGGGGKLDAIASKFAIDPVNNVLDSLNKKTPTTVAITDKVFGVDVPRPRLEELTVNTSDDGGIKVSQLKDFAAMVRNQERNSKGNLEDTARADMKKAMARGNDIAAELEAWNEAARKDPSVQRALSIKNPAIKIPTFDLKIPNIAENSELEKFALSGINVEGWSGLKPREKLNELYKKMGEEEERIIKTQRPFPGDSDNNVKTKWTDYPILHMDTSRMMYLGIGGVENTLESMTEPYDNRTAERLVKVSIKNKIDSHDPEQLKEAYIQTNKALKYFGELHDINKDEPEKQERFADAITTFRQIRTYIEIQQHKPEVEKKLGEMYEGINNAASTAPTILKNYITQVDEQKAREEGKVKAEANNSASVQMQTDLPSIADKKVVSVG